LLVICLSLANCSRYSFRLNDNLLYTPPQVYLVDHVADVSLRNCIQQHIEDQGLKAPEQLQQLICSNAGISNLEGLDRFSRIQQLDLGDNQLNEVSTLFMLANLEYIDLSGNDLIGCEEVNRLKSLVNNSSRFPQECAIENP